ncbi:MAG: S8 family serine peptidase, partial [Pirellulales bacterium]|nr:S8 family serine peptidase [Pirellulales bacterium]
LEDRLVMSADSLGGLLGGSIEHHAIVDQPPAVEHHLQSTPDFWIDTSDQVPLDEYLHQIDQALASAHNQTGLNQVRTDYGFTGIGQTVAVIDSGIAYDHFALGGGYGQNYRVVGGWDFTGENDANPYDDGPSGSHGTHVSGIIGSSHSTHEGVAPGADLVGLRVFDDVGAGYFSWVENALDWIHTNRNSFDNPITAVNLSLGVTSWNSDSIPSWANLEDEFAQLEADGIFISVSAGNSFTSYNTAGLSYPAASSYVVPVMSTDDSGLLSYFSQRHSRAIAAPGRWVTSTVPDYVGNNNGMTDDFASYSGTSMAAPYVAGASVLIREAMEFAGYTNITQDTIYDHMIATADSFFDSATNASYNRLNLEAAIDALMPADDFGSTVATAHSLGTVSSPMATNGAITTLDDVDYFTFTAGSTGTVTLTATNTTHSLTSSWLVDSAPPASGNSVTLDVVAGQNYTVGYASGDGLGYYNLDITAESAFTFTDWGTVTFNQQNNLAVTGETWYRIQAANAGYLTAEGLFDATGGQVNLELYDSNLQLIDTGNAVGGTSRVDVYASAGDELFLKVLGTNSDVDFRLTNLVSLNGATVNVAGTSGADSFAFTGGTTHVVSVNGVTYSFASIAVSSVNFVGGGGSDTMTVAHAGEMDITYAGIEQFSNYDAVAVALKADLGLLNASSNYENWGGWQERWMTSGNGAWYFITSTGDLYRWTGGDNLSTSRLVASLDASFYEDITRLTQAAPTEFMVSTEAASLDLNHGFWSTGNDSYNWGGWGEKWVLSDSNEWHFITSTGDLYCWTGSSDLSASQLVATLNNNYHTDLSMLYDASLNGSPDDLAAQSISQQLGLESPSAQYENWGGWNEKWVYSSSSQWYFITESGGLYRWNGGGGVQESELITVLNSRFYDNTELISSSSSPQTVSHSVDSSALLDNGNLEIRQAAFSQRSQVVIEKSTPESNLNQSTFFTAEQNVIDFAFENLSGDSTKEPQLESIRDSHDEREIEFFVAVDSAMSEHDPFAAMV